MDGYLNRHIFKDSRSVIARFLQRLTLIAFTAHAVLGCCWHHSHAFGEESCQLHGRHAELSSGAVCCAHATDPSNDTATTGPGPLRGSSIIHECHHRDGHSGGLPATDEQPSANLFAVDACPCNHTHECDEARCSYVPRQTNPSDGFLSVPVGDVFPLDSDLLVLSPIGLRRVDTDRTHGRQVESCQQRCANLQSWQI